MIKLKADNLEKRFGRKTVFTDLSFETGTLVLGIAGANGSGKSTLLKCLAALLKPTSGSVKWTLNDHDIKRTDLKNYLGFAAPYIQLYEELTVRENLEFIQNVRSLSQQKPLSDLLEPLGAKKLLDNHFGELSTGQQQRIKLAAAIIHNPDILLLDEPGSNLDEAGKNIITSLVAQFKNSNRMVVIASNQQYELDHCHEIIELKN
ncbi:ABC transporter ATP-binding protein [Rhodohalobacter sulfatireducens]|uniref:ATP-binding cassette domain-containing protein n=1 Tax=Rhodohalobacter sulfatireducens TaxID=2911366 RepID=A0ABS9KES7_9BACT|nr:ATP-binding cassette domain-containing protein [Rhodohalobacter sulfatireducens]MCG2589297.1 ATP-binding cassette domain-containing protein [Rhodohalobacter sulfatireducens]